jgi:hypothetical protein
VELDPPPQLVKPSVLRPSPAPAASRADLARNWRRVRETSLTDNSPRPFDPQPHPSPAHGIPSVAYAYRSGEVFYKLIVVKPQPDFSGCRRTCCSTPTTRPQSAQQEPRQRSPENSRSRTPTMTRKNVQLDDAAPGPIAQLIDCGPANEHRDNRSFELARRRHQGRDSQDPRLIADFRIFTKHTLWRPTATAAEPKPSQAIASRSSQRPSVPESVKGAPLGATLCLEPAIVKSRQAAALALAGWLNWIHGSDMKHHRKHFRRLASRRHRRPGSSHRLESRRTMLDQIPVRQTAH